jgi:hypothetical protein
MDGPLVHSKSAELNTKAVIGLSQRTKILLNLNSSEFPYLQWQRLVLHGIWQRALVVTETAFQTPGLIPGKHYYEGTLDQIPQAIEWFLNDPEGIKAAEDMRNAAFEVLKTQFDFSQIIREMVEHLAIENSQ